ncbi:MAG: tetratricopeptide repeat protein [Marinilabiliales bacterium]|nr:tetratricopeptide repeat protein [Marinilabiliales bacterium]
MSSRIRSAKRLQTLGQKAVQVLPGLYTKLASNALNEKKPAPEVIRAAKTAVSVAEKYENLTGKTNAQKVLAQGYNVMASEYFSKNDYANAILAFDSLLTINPDYLAAIYNKALIYIKQNDAASFEKTIDLYLEKVKSANDEEKTKKASTLALENISVVPDRKLTRPTNLMKLLSC